MNARPLHLTIYRDLEDAGYDGVQWIYRWTLKASNGKIIDASTKAYTRRAGLDANVLQAHGLDVAGVKPGETVVFKREITSWSRFGALAYTGQTIKVTVTP